MLERGAYTFHGSFTSKIAAAKKEAKTPGSFVYQKDGRYYVLKPKVKRNSRTPAKVVSRVSKVRRSGMRSNPGTLIYEKITRIEGTKGKGSQFSGQKFFHNFKRPYPQMWGLSDGSLLIKSRRS